MLRDSPARRAARLRRGVECLRRAPRELGRLRDVPATVVVGAQWGDEGKGKIVDLLAQRSDVVCRYQGGPNAGHTIIVGDETFKIRQTPSGVISRQGLGDRRRLRRRPRGADRRARRARGARHRHRRSSSLSGNAHLIMPWHIAIDQASERRLGKLQIGTTRRGIGPALRRQGLADRHPRPGRARPEDPAPEDRGRARREERLARARLRGRAASTSRRSRTRYEGYAQRLRPIVGDASLLVDQALRAGKDVLFEGAQATLLDLDHGTYPFVTSSNPIASGACDGHRHRPDADRPRPRRRQGVRHARRRGPVPVRDRGPGSGAPAASSAASSAPSPAACAAAAGSTWSRCATPSA